MRDGKDNAVIVCSIENFDPMGVHTGDSITIAPAMTLTDKEYQFMRDAALAVIRGDRGRHRRLQHPVRGGSAQRRDGGHRDEPARVAQLGPGLQGHWLPHRQDRDQTSGWLHPGRNHNDITRETPACFEPTIDYVVTKVPRFAFEKFPGADSTLGPQMKSVGEVMAIGRRSRNLWARRCARWKSGAGASTSIACRRSRICAA